MRKITVTLLSLSLSFMSSVCMAKPQELDKIIAVVNDGIITQAQLNHELDNLQAHYQGPSALPDKQSLQKQVLDKLIMEEIQLQFAKRTGIQIDDAMLDSLVAEVAQRNNLSIDALRRAIADEGGDFTQFRETVRKQHALSQLHQRDILSEVSVSDNEIKQFLKTAEGQNLQPFEYKLSHILISLPDAPSSEVVQATEKKANDLIEKLKGGADFASLAMNQSNGQQALNGGDLGWRALPEIPTLFVGVVGTMQPGDIQGPIRSPSGFHIIKLAERRANAQADAIVEKTQVRHILIKTNAMLSDPAAKSKLENFKREIEQGKDFAVIAKTHSEDLGSSVQGGSLGWVSPEQLVPEFAAVMNETPAGEISEPFKSPFGWHVLHVIARKKENSSEALLQQNAENMIRNRKAEEKLENWLRQMRDEAYIQVKLDGYQDDNA